MEDEKLSALGLADQLPSAQGLLQATPSQSPFSISQVVVFSSFSLVGIDHILVAHTNDLVLLLFADSGTNTQHWKSCYYQPEAQWFGLTPAFSEV